MPRGRRGSGSQSSQGPVYRTTLPFHFGDAEKYETLRNLLEGKLGQADLEGSVGLARTDTNEDRPYVPDHRDCVITVTEIEPTTWVSGKMGTYLSTSVKAVVKSVKGDLTGLPAMLQPGTRLVGTIGGTGLALLRQDTSAADE